MTTPVDATGYTPKPIRDTSGIAGHPRGLSTLFFTELWERFSFYGLKAILFLYMTKALSEGGLQFPGPYAGLIMATYASSVYWTPLVGGWIADKWLGAKRSVLVGGIIIACGHFSMAVDTITTFYCGLALIAIGTGFLKPNVSTMVGDMYDEADERRDAGFSIFYMGINLGAVLAPLVVGSIAQQDFVKHLLVNMGFNPNKSWHWAFSAAGVFMLLGLIQYVAGAKRLKGIGDRKVKLRATDISEVSKAGEEVESGSFDILTIALCSVGGILGFIGGIKWGGAGWIGGLFPGVLFFFWDTFSAPCAGSTVTAFFE